VTDPRPSTPSSDQPPTREDLEQQILGEQPSLTVEGIVAEGEVSLETARRLWRALGFPDADAAPAFTRADGEAMRLIGSLVDDGHLDLDTAVKLTRAVGRTMARLADWQVSTLSEYIEALELEGRGTGSRLRTGLGVLRTVEPAFEKLMTYAWRRHLAAAVGRVEALGANDSDLHTVIVSVGFVDLVRFTDLSNGIGEDRLADVVEDFESICSDLVTGRGGRVIKTLGDSVLFIASGPRPAVDIACDLVERIGADENLPDVHVGIATGPVVMRLGDVFGPPVNLASRLTGIARRNRVLCDAATADGVRETGAYMARAMTARQIRGFGAMQPMSISRLPSRPPRIERRAGPARSSPG
jgi:adenylate cyclase